MRNKWAEQIKFESGENRFLSTYRSGLVPIVALES